jgi:16S rRNA (cytosine1402-N4)-methyltransferase
VVDAAIETEGSGGAFGHVPVMPVEVIGALALTEGMTVVDGTLGLGGHALMMSGIIGSSGRLIGIDQDDQAILEARERLGGFSGRIDIVKSNFRCIDQVLSGLGVSEVDAVLLDLGVSSLQLDDPSRGFSFRHDGPLDMRMDPSAEVSARDIVNSCSEEEISQILWKYGEERFARRIARNIVKARAASSILTTAQLAAIILRSLPYKQGSGGAHPATRSFQGIRIAVNRELEVLEEVLGAAFGCLRAGGRLCVISFHSLEDRIVKEQFRTLSRIGRASLITKKPLRPSSGEERVNPRSRSARMRALERLA